MKKQLIAASVLGLIFYAGQASADMFGFDNITNNNTTDAAIGEAQLSVNVTFDESSGLALFTFSNSGPEASSITDIYFDDDVPLLSFNSFSEYSSGVDFTVGASPSKLPGGNIFLFSSDYAYDSDSPAQPNGINPDEYLTIAFNFVGDYIFQDVLDALYGSSMRIGIHVQGFESGGSESFINNPVPEPATMLLFGTGLVGLAGIARRRNKKLAN